MTLVIPGVATVHPRESWQDPAWPVVGPLDNPANNDTVVIHYTAADNLIDGDPGEHASDLPRYIRNMQRAYAKPKSEGGRGYSLGYLFAVDWLGGVWQIRGWNFQSAANAGHNEHTWPVLVLVDGNDAATDEAAASVRAIVAEATRRAGRPQAIKGHGQLRRETGIGTSTSCCGVGLQAQVDAGVFEPRPIPIPPPDIPTPPPAQTQEFEHMLYIIRPDFEGANADTEWLVKFDDGHIERALGSTISYATAVGLPIVVESSPEHYNYQLDRRVLPPMPVDA